MSARELIVLGTASQVPTRYRNHNAYFLRWDAEGLLFDPGEGTQRQMLLAGVTASQIHRVFITHFHGDHALGMAGLVQRFSLDKVPHPVHIYYPASGQVYFDRLRNATIFQDMSNIVPHPIREEGILFQTPQFLVEARRLQHGVETFGYALKEKDSVRMLPEKIQALGIKGPLIGQLQREGKLEWEGRTVLVGEVSEPKPGQKFAFIMDTRPCRGATELAAGADLLVCESTYLDSEKEEAWAHYHMTAAQAATLAAQGGVRRLVLTHFSQRYFSLEPFMEEAGKIFGDVRAASDLDRIAVPDRL
jgi:ribonuclease Z